MNKKIKIGITINEVIRDFIFNYGKVYKKYIDNDYDEDCVNDIINEDLTKHFKFDSSDKFYDFTYEEASLELFGHPDVSEGNIINELNKFMVDLEFENENVEFYLLSKEVNRAIPGTMFFLSKTNIKIKKYRFDYNLDELLNDIDVLITASPEFIEHANKGCTIFKIEAPYNKECEVENAYDKLSDLINSNNIINKILKKW